MANQILSRTLPKTLALSSFFSRSLSTASSSSALLSRSPLSFLCGTLRPLAAASADFRGHLSFPALRPFSTRATSSSLNDPNPNWSNRPPKETILLDGCDFEHWLVVMEKPDGDPTRDEIIDSYIKTLAQVVGSEEEARMKIYSVSTRHYYAFGALVSEELSYKLKELPRVRWVLPDSYLDVKNKDYGGEPFINGQAVPYDPKYHEEWVRNNARANERNRRNDRPRNADRSRNFDRRRENIVNRDMQNRPPMSYETVQNPGPNMGGAPPSNAGGYPPNMGRAPPSNAAGFPPSNAGGLPPNNAGGFPPSNAGGLPPNNAGGFPPSNAGGLPPSNAGGLPPNNAGGFPPSNAGGFPPSNAGGLPPNNAGRFPPSNAGGLPPNNAGGFPPSNAGGFPPNNASGFPPNNAGGFPSNNAGGFTPNNAGGFPPNNAGGFTPNNAGRFSPNNAGGFPPNNAGGSPPNNPGGFPPNHMGGVPHNSGYSSMPLNSPMGGMTSNNMGGMPPNHNMGGVQPNAGYSGNFPGRDYQPNYAPNRDMGATAGGNPYSP